MIQLCNKLIEFSYTIQSKPRCNEWNETPTISSDMCVLAYITNASFAMSWVAMQLIALFN